MVLFTNFRLLTYNKYGFLRCKSKNELHTKLWRLYNTCISEEQVTFSNGNKITLSTGKYARFANGCAVAAFGDTAVMVTAVNKPQPTDGGSANTGVPLVVDYRQKAAAAGRIPTNFLRRELAFNEYEILTSRLIDRSIRPLFPEGYNYDTQISCNMLAIDSVHDPDVLAINGASTALCLSDIPWNGPIGAVRIGMIDNELKVNPTRREIQQSDLNLIIAAAKQNAVIMIEGSANDILETDIRKAIKIGVKDCQHIIRSIELLQKKCGKTKKVIEVTEPNLDLLQSIKSHAEDKLVEVFSDYNHDKISRDNAINDIRHQVIDTLKNEYPDINQATLEREFSTFVKNIFRTMIIQNDVRCDGRKTTDLRDISCQVNLFEPLHGSAVFQRGQTQVLCTVTLDALDSALKMDTVSMLISGKKEKNFFLHYEFPSYATNEVKRVSSIGRREMGHGALAEKAIRPVVPQNYPFTIRLTSEVLESNGSSSMASVCGGSLALLDAGVPITSAVAGVAIGLITRREEQSSNIKDTKDYKILTDILGIEDYFGDMDFKFAGTKKGITALQLDMKIPGLPIKIIMESIQQAVAAKNKILGIMHNTIRKPRTDHGDKMPITEELEVPVHQRGKFLGVGGTNLRKIFVETGVHIQAQNETTYSLFAPNKSAMDEAREIIDQLLSKDREPELEFGAIYTAKIVEIRETGVMVTLYPTMVPVLLHNSQLDQRKIHHPSALGFEVGQELQIKYFGRDPASGQMRISRKVLQEPVSFVKNMTSDSSSV